MAEEPRESHGTDPRCPSARSPDGLEAKVNIQLQGCRMSRPLTEIPLPSPKGFQDSCDECPQEKTRTLFGDIEYPDEPNQDVGNLRGNVRCQIMCKIADDATRDSGTYDGEVVHLSECGVGS